MDQPDLTLAPPNSPAVASGATAQYTAILKDLAGNPLPAVQVFSLSLSIIDTATGAVINDVENVNILNVDRGTVDSQGKVTVTLGAGINAADTTILDPTKKTEARTLILAWAYNGGDFVGTKRIGIEIMGLVP